MKTFGLAPGLCCLGLVLAAASLSASDCCDGPASCTSCTSCTGGGPCCEPRCRASWDEVKTKKPAYSMKCEYACTRGRDSWHAPEPDCRCSPPCGTVYVKKRLYKLEGEEKVERVPKYEVDMVPTEACGCRTCCGGGTCWWNPLHLLPWFQAR